MKAKEAVQIELPQRGQVELVAESLDDRLPDEHFARTVWQFVCRLDVGSFYNDAKSFEGNVGRPLKDRRVLFALWLYAYSEGIGSGRRIATLCTRDDAYRWIAGGLAIDYHTLNDFRSLSGSSFSKALTQTITVLIHEQLIDVSKLEVDGTKIRARAKGTSFKSRDKLRRAKLYAQQHVANVASQSDEITSKQKAARESAAQRRLEKINRAAALLDKLEPNQRPASKKKQR